MCVPDCPPPGFPLKKKNMKRKEHRSRTLWILRCGLLAETRDGLGARAGPGEGAGAGRGVGERTGWVEDLLIVVDA